MKTLTTLLFATLISGCLSCGSLMADAIILPDLPDTDTISISLNPLDGDVAGTAGSTVGWGFTVNWSSQNGDLVTFVTTSIQSETNPALMAGYTDYIGYQGGPNAGFLSPSSSPWTEVFAPVAQPGIGQGVGAYQITSNPGTAVIGAEDIGQVAFYFQVYDSTGSIQLGDSSYSYSTDYSVTVVGAPEPATFFLLLPCAALLAVVKRRRILP